MNQHLEWIPVLILYAERRHISYILLWDLNTSFEQL